jgi:hypothetical protein
MLTSSAVPRRLHPMIPSVTGLIPRDALPVRARTTCAYFMNMYYNMLYFPCIYVYADLSSSTSLGILRRTFRETPSSCNTVSCTIWYPCFLGIQSKKTNQYTMPTKPIDNAKTTCDCMPIVNYPLPAHKEIVVVHTQYGRCS